MTGGWAATNTLRTAIRPFDYDDTPYNNADVQAALALVETALDAAQELEDAESALRGCSLLDQDEVDRRVARVTKARAALAAALRAVREGAS